MGFRARSPGKGLGDEVSQKLMQFRHGSFTFMSITIKLQLHLILPITITVTVALVACKNRYGIRSRIFLRYCPSALVQLLHETKHYSSVSSANVNFTCYT